MRDDKLWPIDTDDDVERLARHCGWGDNRRYMTPTDYAIWCERMRKFAALAALREQEPVASIPAGYKLVPAWPTPEWVQSAAKGIRITTIEHVINDVLAAAPEPPALNSHKMPQHAARHGDLRIDRLYADYYGDVSYD